MCSGDEAGGTYEFDVKVKVGSIVPMVMWLHDSTGTLLSRRMSDFAVTDSGAPVLQCGTDGKVAGYDTVELVIANDSE